MTAAGFFITACLAAGFANSAFAQTECAWAETNRNIAIEIRRFDTPGPQPGPEDVARLLVPSPCKTSPAPGLVLESADLGLLAEDWRRGARELEQARLNR